jgi:hypothetical protein
VESIHLDNGLDLKKVMIWNYGKYGKEGTLHNNYLNNNNNNNNFLLVDQIRKDYNEIFDKMQRQIWHDHQIYIHKGVFTLTRTYPNTPGYLDIVRHKLGNHLIKDWKIRSQSIRDTRSEYILNMVVKWW